MLPSAAAVLRERDLKGYQEEFREVDAEFKALGVMQDRANLLEGAHAARRDDPSRKTNTELLEGALSRQQETTNKLRVRGDCCYPCSRVAPPISPLPPQEALGTVAATQETARFTAATLEEDREKLKRIDKGLDEVDSELEISRKLITRFVKRLYTDKVGAGPSQTDEEHGVWLPRLSSLNTGDHRLRDASRPRRRRHHCLLDTQPRADGP
jgi:hypothetical protein